MRLSPNRPGASAAASPQDSEDKSTASAGISSAGLCSQSVAAVLRHQTYKRRPSRNASPRLALGSRAASISMKRTGRVWPRHLVVGLARLLAASPSQSHSLSMPPSLCPCLSLSLCCVCSGLCRRDSVPGWQPWRGSVSLQPQVAQHQTKHVRTKTTSTCVLR